MLALKYQIGEEVRLYIFQKYVKYRKEIEGREDTFKITSERDLLGKISFEEYDNILHNLRQDAAELLSVQNDEEWIDEDIERENTEEI